MFESKEVTLHLEMNFFSVIYWISASVENFQGILSVVTNFYFHVFPFAHICEGYCFLRLYCVFIYELARKLVSVYTSNVLTANWEGSVLHGQNSPQQKQRHREASVLFLAVASIDKQANWLRM